MNAVSPLTGTDYTNITVDFNPPTSQSGDDLSYFFNTVTYSSNQWPFSIQNTNPFDIVFNLSARTFFNEFPVRIELDIGDDGTLDWLHPNEVKGNEMTSTLNHKFNPLIRSKVGIEDQWGTDFVTIPVRVNSTGNGTLQLHTITIEYEFTTTLTGFGSDINSYVQAHKAEGALLNVPVKVHSSSKGKVQLDRLNYTYDGRPIYWPLIPLNLNIDEDTADFRLLDLDKHFVDDYDTDLDYEVLDWQPKDSVILSIHDGRWLAADTLNATNGTDWFGDVTNIRIRATDDRGFKVDTQAWTFEVMAVNDPPVITSTPSMKAEVGEAYTYKVNVTDVEGDDLIFSLIEKPAHMTIDPLGLISWAPEFADVGTHNVTVDVFDGIDAVNQSYTIDVTTDNRAPTINSTPPTIAWVGEEYRYEVTGYDPDPFDELMYTLDPLHPWGMELNGVILTWTPGQTQVGDNPVKILLSDGMATVSQEWVIVVGVNNPPEFTSNPPTTGKVGVEYVYQVTASDDDHDIVTFSLKEKPENMTMDSNGRITWMPNEGDNNFTWIVEIVATDGKANRSQRYDITISAKDTPPPPPPNGNGNHTDGLDIMSILPYLLIVIIVVVIIAVFAATRRRKKDKGGGDDEDGEDGEEDEWPEMGSGKAGAVVKAKRTDDEDDNEEAGVAGTTIDDVFLIYRDGRLITHQARRLSPDMDSDIMSGMFTAIQSFIKDSFDKEGSGDLKSFEYSDQKILMSHSDNVYLAMVISGGAETPAIRKRMKASLEEIEHKFGTELKDWNGRLDSLKGVNRSLKPLVAMTIAEKHRAIESELVNLLGDVEFQKGFIVVKCALINGAGSVITDSEIKLIFNKDALRVDHVHPDLPLDGSEVKMGNLAPDEKKTVAFYLDPLICVKSNIDASVTFKDSKGALRTKSMEQLKAEVVCPVLYSDEEINTGMLKRLVGDLKVHDSKVFPIPSSMTAKRTLDMGKELLGNYDLRLVREFDQRTPYSAEAWYYGKAKFSKKPVVVKVSVSEETNSIQFFVATEELSVLTGLLAELGHEFAKALRTEGISEKVSHIVDPVERDRIIRQTELLLHKHVASEEAEGEISPSDTEK